FRICPDGRRRPAPGVEVAVGLASRRPSPRKDPLRSGGISGGRAMQLALRGQALALPARIGARLGEAHVEGPVGHSVEGQEREQSAIQRPPVLLRPPPPTAWLLCE